MLLQYEQSFFLFLVNGSTVGYADQGLERQSDTFQMAADTMARRRDDAHLLTTNAMPTHTEGSSGGEITHILSLPLFFDLRPHCRF